jgi:LAO/AO transport system kinase
VFERFRREQTVKWVHDMIREHLQNRFYKDPAIMRELPDIEAAVADGRLPAVTAVQQLLEVFRKPEAHSENGPSNGAA